MRMRRLYQTFTFSGSGKVKRGRSRRFYDNLSLEERNGINNVQTISTSLSKAYIEEGHVNPSIRWKRNYGLLARNVNNVEIATCSSLNSSAVFISQREGEYRNIDFSEKYTSLDENGIYYKNVLVASQVSSFHPANRTALFCTKGKEELLFTGDGTSFTPFTKEKIGEFCEVHALSLIHI